MPRTHTSSFRASSPVREGHINMSSIKLKLDSQVDIAGYNHTVNICDQSGVCVGLEPDASDVWVGSYFIAGQSVYQPLEVKLFLWEES